MITVISRMLIEQSLLSAEDKLYSQFLSLRFLSVLCASAVNQLSAMSFLFSQHFPRVPRVPRGSFVFSLQNLKAIETQEVPIFLDRSPTSVRMAVESGKSYLLPFPFGSSRV